MYTRRQLLAGLGCGGIVGMAGCLSEETGFYPGDEEERTKWWPQPQYDGYGTCFNPETTVSADSPSVRWELEISSPSARPIIVDSVAVLPTSEAVRAVSTVDGSELWTATEKDSVVWPRSVAAHDGLVFISSSEEPELMALGLQTGKRTWERTFERPPKAFTIDYSNSHLLFGDDTGTVYSVDPATGKTNWKRSVFGPISTIVTKIGFHLIGTEGGEVYALYGEQGDGLWRRRFPGAITALGSRNGSHSGAGAFVSCFSGSTFALNPSSAGATVWSKDLWSPESVVVTSSHVYTAGTSISAINYRNGKRSWSVGETVQCGPAAAGDLVFVGAENAVEAYKMGGGAGLGGIRIDTKGWRLPVDGTPQRGFAVADGALFVMTQGGNGEPSKAYAIE
ncbi:outer membrane protein assembly factor BamB family protein [Halocatena halophila]|uniref:outer membrane protein assembly factor BamB family protein n=1 Tax=Halocatena halophila TaxID=2814576 RepID=UPI002ED4532A